jgi:hypothetical protein
MKKNNYENSLKGFAFALIGIILTLLIAKLYE